MCTRIVFSTPTNLACTNSSALVLSSTTSHSASRTIFLIEINLLRIRRPCPNSRVQAPLMQVTATERLQYSTSFARCFGCDEVNCASITCSFIHIARVGLAMSSLFTRTKHEDPGSVVSSSHGTWSSSYQICSKCLIGRL